MKTENILAIEESGENRINLVRDRLFWQAWNKSAFLFASHIKNYQVHKRFVQKVAQEVAWLGFPSSVLSAIQKTATDKGFGFEQKSADHILLNSIFRIREFLQSELKLTLHPKKIRLQPADKGFAFLGAYIYPNKIAVGKRIVKNFRECIFNPLANRQKQAQRVQSYLGLTCVS